MRLPSMWRWPKNFLQEKDIPAPTLRARAHVIGAILPLVAMINGALISASNNNQWDGRSLDALMAFPHAAQVFGVALLVFGVVLQCGTVADFGPMIWGAGWACGLWYSMAAVATFYVGVHETNQVDFSGAALWGLTAVTFILQAQCRVDGTCKPVEEPSSSQKD